MDNLRLPRLLGILLAVFGLVASASMATTASAADPGTIGGTVVLPTGGSTYMSLRNLDGTSVASAGIAEDGTYTFTGVADGSYLVVAESSQTVLRTFYPGTHDAAAATPVVVADSQPVTGINFEAIAAGLITGTVTVPSAQPRDYYVGVRVYDEAGVLVGETLSNVSATNEFSGPFTIGGLAAGTYSVAFQRSEGVPDLARRRVLRRRSGGVLD